MKRITVTAILSAHGKWITRREFVQLVSKKRNIKERQAYNVIKKAVKNKEIKKHILSDRTTLYGLPEFGPPLFKKENKYNKDDFLNFGVDHGLISSDDLKRLTLPIEKVPRMFEKTKHWFSPIRLIHEEKFDIDDTNCLVSHSSTNVVPKGSTGEVIIARAYTQKIQIQVVCKDGTGIEGDYKPPI